MNITKKYTQNREKVQKKIIMSAPPVLGSFGFVSPCWSHSHHLIMQSLNGEVKKYKLQTRYNKLLGMFYSFVNLWKQW